ncbi:MAG TPA: GNAT family N-acetyltransferase [Pirellulales bacterium]|jgi:ribosomal protein S18 acetylase RimI-like enzyme|nr:GNAT family N-acetyltransferase [Pirellulales bacterium]
MPPTPDKVKIRPAEAADVPTIVEFNRRLALESEAKQLDASVLTKGVQIALERPELCRYFLAETNGQVIGQTMLTYEWSDWRAGVFWWIQSVYVQAEYRGRGVFRALFEHVAELAKAAPDVCGLRLYVEQHNAAAVTTYQRLGMVASGHLLYELDWSGAIAEARPKD